MAILAFVTISSGSFVAKLSKLFLAIISSSASLNDSEKCLLSGPAISSVFYIGSIAKEQNISIEVTTRFQEFAYLLTGPKISLCNNLKNRELHTHIRDTLRKISL